MNFLVPTLNDVDHNNGKIDPDMSVAYHNHMKSCKK